MHALTHSALTHRQACGIYEYYHNAASDTDKHVLFVMPQENLAAYRHTSEQ